MKIAVGSRSGPEVEALKEAWQVFSTNILRNPDEPISYATYEISSGTSRVPLAVRDLMQGALTRVETLILQLKREKAEADFYVGLEHGFNIVDFPGARRQVFLESWAYVSDGHEGYFGHGGGIYVPPQIANPVVDRGIELEIVIDRVGEGIGLPAGEDAWGILTQNIIDRKHSFVIALIAAFAPFYNPGGYH